MIISSASKQKYNEPVPTRVRGTQEYNPLYDAFQSDLIIPVRPQLTQDGPSVRTMSTNIRQQSPMDFESAYDKPRNFRSNGDQRETRLEQRAVYSKKSGEILS